MATIPHKKGNSLDLPMQVTLNGSAYDLTGKTVVYRLLAPTVIEFTDGAGLTITDALLGLFKLTATRTVMDFAEGSYLGATRITDAAVPGFELELPDGSDPDDPTYADVWEIGPEYIPVA
jgi:hypothetical protein